jgi:putative acetyltransferase
VNIKIRKATPKDLNSILELFVSTIKATCATDYNPQQIEVWVASSQNPERWLKKIESHYFIVAEENHAIIGFGSLEENNNIDLMYVHHEHLRKGVAQIIFEDLEKEAKSHIISELIARVSKTAKPFFEKNGFVKVQTKKNKIGNVTIINFAMKKEMV